MAKRKESREPVPKPPVPVDLAAAMTRATGCENQGAAKHLVSQVMETIWIPAELGKKEQRKRIVAAVELLRSIKPQDELEGLLATQMIATHSAAMECLRRSMIPKQSFEGRDSNLRQASRLLSILSKQFEVLNRNRGKGQQKVTVEHVEVQRGGQAIVGNVERSPK